MSAAVLQLEVRPTTQIVTIRGVPCRTWLGKTPAGQECFLYVARVAVPIGGDHEAFEAALEFVGEGEMPTPGGAL